MKELKQSPAAVVMIRPHQFVPNPETEADNSFQNKNVSLETSKIHQQAYDEVSSAAETLEAQGVTVHLFEDKGNKTPDSVFPNNWFSTHADQSIAVYPMYCPNRRAERRTDIVDFLSSEYSVQKTVDFSFLEKNEIFLEGTGSMVLDHQNRIAYAIISKRMDESALEMFCKEFNYSAVAFNACDKNGVAIYHTNVLMCVATDFVLIALEMIKDRSERELIMGTIIESGKVLVELTEAQIEQFAGNALELEPEQGKLLAISQTAVDALSTEQKDTIGKFVKIIPLNVKTIELAGGSVRCMLAGIHLQKK